MSDARDGDAAEQRVAEAERARAALAAKETRARTDELAAREAALRRAAEAEAAEAEWPLFGPETEGEDEEMLLAWEALWRQRDEPEQEVARTAGRRDSTARRGAQNRVVPPQRSQAPSQVISP
ncbi:MAG: hypothetical protein ACK4QW_19355, partial [Alphaproteobacteria bacterium]